MDTPLTQASWITATKVFSVVLGIDDPVWDATSFTKNRGRLLEGDVAVKFLAGVPGGDSAAP